MAVVASGLFIFLLCFINSYVWMMDEKKMK